MRVWARGRLLVSNESTAAGSTAAAYVDDERPRVLAIDDTEGNRYAVARILRGAGMQVLEAATGRDGLRLAAELPDLILVDINLPDMTGIDLVKTLRADPKTASIPMMHVSASFTAPDDQVYGLEAGADAYLTHPIDPTLFLATVRALLRAGAAEAKTRAAAREWQATFDAISDAIFVLDERGQIRQANLAAGRLLKRDTRSLVGESLPAIVEAEGGDRAGAVALATSVAPAESVELSVAGRLYTGTTYRIESGTDAGPIVCVLTNIDARKATERERELLLARAEEARGAAEQANRSKSDFLAVASHELRTPLNAIAGFVQLLALGIRGPLNEAQLADLEKIRRSQIALTGLINDLLSFARLERGSVTYEIESVPVDEMLSTCADMIEMLTRERGIHLRVDHAAASMQVAADADKFQQIVLNLLSNSLKFTPPGGSITVSSEQRGHDVHVRVVDTGVGIPGDKLDVIFNPFVQVDQRRARAQEGIGLGLSISRELARAMGGDLTVTSALGRGSEFTLCLPAAQVEVSG
jgi:signal transduction histidine kinase